MEAQQQIGAQQGLGECVYSSRFAATGGRVKIKAPPRSGIVGWMLTLLNYPTAAGALPAFAFVIVNSTDPAALTSILGDGGGAPRGGLPLSPGQPLNAVIRADTDFIWVDIRGVDATLMLDAVVSVEVQLHALYATPKCPEVAALDCLNAPPEKRRKGC